MISHNQRLDEDNNKNRIRWNAKTMHKHTICPSNSKQRTNTVCLQISPLSCLQTPLNSMTKHSKMLSRQLSHFALHHTLYTSVMACTLYNVKLYVSIVPLSAIYTRICQHKIFHTMLETGNNKENNNNSHIQKRSNLCIIYHIFVRDYMLSNTYIYTILPCLFFCFAAFDLLKRWSIKLDRMAWWCVNVYEYFRAHPRRLFHFYFNPFCTRYDIAWILI